MLRVNPTDLAWNRPHYGQLAQGIPHSVTLTLDLHLKYLILIPDSLVAFGEHGVQHEFRTELNNLLKVLGFGVNVGRLTAGPWATCKLPNGQPMATNS